MMVPVKRKDLLVPLFLCGLDHHYGFKYSVPSFAVRVPLLDLWVLLGCSGIRLLFTDLHSGHSAFHSHTLQVLIQAYFDAIFSCKVLQAVL